MGMLDVLTLSTDFSNVSLYLIIAIASSVIYLIYQRVVNTENWSKYGVKQASMSLVQLREGFRKLIEEHGDTVGISRNKMWLVTRDLSILKEVMVKDFNSFTDRPIGLISQSLINKGVFFLKGQDWRRIRHIITPSFSSGKLKNIFKTVQDKAGKLTAFLEECARKDKLVPIKHTTGQYTSEIIARTAFGYNTDCIGGDDDEFTYYCKKLLRIQNKKLSFLLPLFQGFPWVQTFLVKTMRLSMFDGVSPDADQYMNSVLRKSLDERQEAELKGQRLPADMLQSFISAKKTGEQAGNDDSSLTSDRSLDPKLINKTMSEDELISQSLLIIFAGFETTATTLQMCLYMLAKHPDVQEKVYEEIERVVQSDSPTYEELSQLTYMEKVINETLRLYPPVSVISRQAAETKTYGSITIPKGAAVFIPIFSVLKDPKNFPDPEKFDPERFNVENSAKRDPMAFMPFGFGPRLCIGSRLAYMELIVALTESLRKVQLELNDKTEPKKGEELKLRSVSLLVPEDPIKLSVKLRN